MTLGTVTDLRPTIEVSRVTKRYAATGPPAVDGVSFDVRPGEIFGVLGRNGAGKSTLVRIMVGLLRPGSGSVRLPGGGGGPMDIAARVAYLPQAESALGDMTVRTAVESTARLRGVPRRHARAKAEDVLDELDLAALAGARVGELSGGQRRLAGVATALAGDRPVLVLDEPTSGVDHAARRRVWAALERRRAVRGAAVVLVTHDVREAETVLDRVLVLHRGRAVGCDTPGRLKERFDGQVRLDLIWRDDVPAGLPDLGGAVHRNGRRWSVRLPAGEATDVLRALLDGPALTALDDFTLATPSLADVLPGDDARPGDGS